MLRDLALLAPEEIVMLGDHLDCGGVFSVHQRSYTKELAESFEADCDAANALLDSVQLAAPKAAIHYLEGNHEAHVERWAARQFTSQKDAEHLLANYGPAAVLRLKDRGIRYYRSSDCHMGLSIPGTIRLGRCFATHGITASEHAAAAHLARFSANVVFGHVHRSMAIVERAVTSDGRGAWSPGTLAKLQPLYLHTNPSKWTHGYGLQIVRRSDGKFMHINVPILNGASLIREVLK